jgi:hypothetical protein
MNVCQTLAALQPYVVGCGDVFVGDIQHDNTTAGPSRASVC